jgi:cell division protein FtsQ
VAIALPLALVVGYTAIRTARTTRLLAVRNVVVRGNSRLSTSEVETLLHGIRGQNILLADLDLYRRQLMDSPWVAGASIRRLLPATVEVKLAERAPMAITRIDGRLYLVDDTGVVIDAFGPRYREFDLPVVDGLAASSPPGTSPVSQVDEARAQLTHRFLEALHSAPALRQRVSQIDVSDEHDLILLLADDPTLVHLGEARFLERLTTYQELAPALQDRLQSIDYVDMRFDERVYVKSKTPRKAAGKRTGGAERADAPRRRG